uniref:Galectin n=1 Tax=Hucho hucho TaxID=62062 RepID=A0A4W5M460_9TELE
MARTAWCSTGLAWSAATRPAHPHVAWTTTKPFPTLMAGTTIWRWSTAQPANLARTTRGRTSQPTWPGQPSQPNASQHQSLKVPYDQNLPNGCYDKMVITINGTINHNAKMFTLNLTKGNDIAMHINPRFDGQGKKMIGSKWGKEEREHNHFPITQGQPFEMKIMCTNNEFRVAVNSSHLLEFKHRIRDLDSNTWTKECFCWCPSLLCPRHCFRHASGCCP